MEPQGRKNLSLGRLLPRNGLTPEAMAALQAAGGFRVEDSGFSLGFRAWGLEF